MEKFDEYKKALKHKRIDAMSLVGIKDDPSVFQGYQVMKLSDISFPLTLKDEEIIIDFGDHYTGYLHMALQGTKTRIPDSPTLIRFDFAEMPIELMREYDPSVPSLSAGWVQRDYKSIAFMPYQGNLERRYAFRYVRLKREDSLLFDVEITDLFIDSVSAVDLDDLPPFRSGDRLLDRIDLMCVKTLKECEQDVFEDGPKRDRRLWIGDLRLQALVDYRTFRNIDLIKRCLYLFAYHLNDDGLVAPCVFPDTAPYVDQWIYLDYSLCLMLCISDYYENTGDASLPNELYDIAFHQILYANKKFDRGTGKIEAPFFIDHGDYDRSVAALGYFAYALLRARELADKLSKPTEQIDGIYDDVKKALLLYYDKEKGVFITKGGEISWHAQVWAILSGFLTESEGAALLEAAKRADPKIRMSSPFMIHYYLEALYSVKRSEEAEDYIKKYWGAMLEAGFDCCPECFDEKNDMLTPYNNIILNSACHAWGCTASYFIRKTCERR